MNIAVRFWLIFCSLLLFTSNKILAEPVNPTSPLTETTDGKTYLNEFFKLSVEKPNGWYSQNLEENTALLKMGSDLVTGDDKNSRAIANAALKSTIPIFSFFLVPPGTPGKPNPNVISVAENIKAFPGIKNGCDYFSLTKETLINSQVKIDFEDKCESRVLNGTEFKIVNAQISLGKQQIKQRYFSLIKDGYAVSIIQTYFSPESEVKVNQVVNSVKIKP